MRVVTVDRHTFDRLAQHGRSKFKMDLCDSSIRYHPDGSRTFEITDQVYIDLTIVRHLLGGSLCDTINRLLDYHLGRRPH